MQIIIPENKKKDIDVCAVARGSENVEITLKPHSHLNLSCALVERSGKLKIKLRLEEGASLKSFTAILAGGDVSFHQETLLSGKNSSVEQHIVFVGRHENIFDLISKTIVENEEVTAKIYSSGILRDKATARLDGSIEILESAKRADCYLSQNTLLLSPDAKINTIPALIIKNNDVRAGHAAKVTNINEDQLFYALSRGISIEQAKQLIADGFLKNACASYPKNFG